VIAAVEWLVTELRLIGIAAHRDSVVECRNVRQLCAFIEQLI
jgi:hypothetical protein